MNADQYLDHWLRGKVWKHLLWPKHQERFRRIASCLEGKSFLDAGCMFGHSTYHLSRFRPGDWSGVDFSSKVIDIARRVCAEKYPNLTILPAVDFEGLSKMTKFDSVVCSEVIEHTEDDLGLIKALKKITKKILVLTTPCIRVSDPGHLRIYDEESIKALMEKALIRNFRIERSEQFFYIIADFKKK